jgi:hypothetical protein
MRYPRLENMAIEHWKKYRPKMYRELLKGGKLQERVVKAAQLTEEALEDLLSEGVPYDQAWELVREMWICLPTEEDVPLLGEDPTLKNAI